MGTKTQLISTSTPGSNCFPEEIYDFKEYYDASKKIYDFHDQTTKLELMIELLPPMEKWNSDVKLKTFSDLLVKVEKLSCPENEKTDLYTDIKTCAAVSRSAALGAKWGHMLEDIVATIFKDNGWSVDRNVKKYKFFDESVDIVAVKGSETFNVMIQMGLWEGGHQSNRLMKYLTNNNIDRFTNNGEKYLCIVYNEYTPPKRKKKSEKQKIIYDTIVNAICRKNLIWVGHLRKFLHEREL